MKGEFLTWAIDTRSKEVDFGYVGRYFFVDTVPASNDGCVVALFKTRAIARQHLTFMRSGYNPFPEACVVRVKVSIQPHERSNR